MTAEHPEQPGRVPVGELRALVKKFDDPEWGQKKDYYAEIGLHIAAKELEAVIERYE